MPREYPGGRPGGMRGLGGGDYRGGGRIKEIGRKEESSGAERVLGFAQTHSRRSLPLLLKLAGGAGFRSSAHPAGPNEPSCLDLNIYLPICLRNKDPYPFGSSYPYPYPYPWLHPAQCSLSSFLVFVLILMRIQLSGFALVIVLSLSELGRRFGQNSVFLEFGD